MKSQTTLDVYFTVFDTRHLMLQEDCARRNAVEWTEKAEIRQADFLAVNEARKDMIIN